MLSKFFFALFVFVLNAYICDVDSTSCICYGFKVVWGTEILARLEDVKASVDPHSMLSCYGCVQNKKSTTTDGAATSTPPTTMPTSTDATLDTTNKPTSDPSSGWKVVVPFSGFALAVLSVLLHIC